MILKPKPFVFMRHAQTAFNHAKLMGGITDTPLNENGERQALAAKIFLAQSWSVVATSTLVRTQQTAALAVPNQSQIHLEALNERNWGALEGTPIKKSIVYEETPLNGESWGDFQHRVLSAINQLLERYHTPLIIAHSGIYRVLCQAIYTHPYGPRIDNATPYLFSPKSNAHWNISKYEGSTHEI